VVFFGQNRKAKKTLFQGIFLPIIVQLAIIISIQYSASFPTFTCHSVWHSTFFQVIEWEIEITQQENWHARRFNCLIRTIVNYNLEAKETTFHWGSTKTN